MTPAELKAARQRMGMTQQQLAKRIGFADHKFTISKMERGKTPIPVYVDYSVRYLETRWRANRRAGRRTAARKLPTVEGATDHTRSVTAGPSGR